MIRPYCCLLAAAALLATTAVHAEVYKWVDEDGVTHYSQQPPPEGTGTLLKPAASPPSSDAGKDGNGESADNADGQQGEDEDGADTIAEFCSGLREKKKILESDRPVRIKADDGTLTTMTDEQRAQRLQRVQGQLDDHCQGVRGGGDSG